jgi:release factor glutamine methyltransferase
MPTPAPRTVAEYVAAGSAYLARHQLENPLVACELLASHLFQCGRLELFRHYPETPAVALVDAWRGGLKRLADGEPLQYVLGEWDFRQLTLTVDRRALIPRPETEELVDLVLAKPELWQGDRADAAALPLLVDVGTGSGCIALSLAWEKPRARYVAIDASAEALELARANAQRCGLADRVEFRLAHGCGEFPAGSVAGIIANLPYIPTAEIATLERQIRAHEPHQALDGGPDGLDIVRQVARDAAMVLRAGGWLFLEIGNAQGPATHDLLEELGFLHIQISADLAGHTRFAQAQLSAL